MSRIADRYCLFKTAFGMCGVGWSTEGISHVQLPEANGQADEMRLMRLTGAEAPSDPPPPVVKAISLLERYFSGAPVDFKDVTLDLSEVGRFEREVLFEARQIGWGDVATYGDLAQRVAELSAAQAVGQAMAHNPVPIIVPCHRVLASDGSLGGFSAPGGVATKKRLLEMEGAAHKVAALAQLDLDF